MNSHRGLYQYKRISYGIESAPPIFQRCIESIVAGIPNVLVFLVDILITGKTLIEHQQNLYEALGRLEKADLKLGVNKCQFYMNLVAYLGNKISCKGIKPLPEKLQAILKMPRPTNTAEVQAYLGHVNFYRTFSPILSKTLELIHHLLRKGVCFKWMREQEAAFTEVQTLIQSAGLLNHYDHNKEVVITCDTSPKGVGAVLYHVMQDGRSKSTLEENITPPAIKFPIKKSIYYRLQLTHFYD